MAKRVTGLATTIVAGFSLPNGRVCASMPSPGPACHSTSVTYNRDFIRRHRTTLRSLALTLPAAMAAACVAQIHATNMRDDDLVDTS